MSGLLRTRLRLIALCVPLLASAGCGCRQEPGPGAPSEVAQVLAPGLVGGARSDEEKVRTADVSILFVGNSHTSGHNLPNLVCEMIRFQHPAKTAYAQVVSVAFLEDVANNPAARQEIETRPWKFVVLQAQKISVSGKQDYSRVEGIEFAKLAKSRGASVFYFCEWPLRDAPEANPREEKVYREMAAEAAVSVAFVNRAWTTALAARPDLPLYSPDGNHQSATGAFLTATYLTGRLTGESPAPLAAFPFAEGSESDRKFLAESAAKALATP